MDQGPGYPVNSGQYGLESTPLNDNNPWTYQYGQQNEHFGVSQNAPPSTLGHPPYQQFVESSPSYNNYGIGPDSMYPIPSYSGSYAPQYQQSNPLSPYVMSPYGTGPSQASSQVEQSFTASSRPWVSYSPVYPPEVRTISPSALQRVDNTPQSQRVAQPWPHDAIGGYQQQNVTNQTGVSSQKTPSRGIVVGYASTFHGIADPGPTVAVSSQGSDATQGTVLRRGTTTSRQSFLRITHPELLSSTENVPMRRIGVAPYLVLDVEPVELEVSARAKNNMSKPINHGSSRALIPGLENSASTTTSASSIKNRGRPLKLTASTTKAVKQGDQKEAGSLISSKGKPSESTPSSEEESSPAYDSSSEEESEDEAMLEQISDVRGETRPTDVVEAAAWDAIGTFYVPSWRNASTDEIIKGTQDFGKYFQNLRDELVSISTDLAKAEAEKRLDDVKRLKDARILKRKVISSAIQATIKFGKESVMRNFGKSQKLINALINVLRDCVKSKDLDDEVFKAVLNLLARCDFITDDLLQKAKFEPIVKRFPTNNNAEIKGYIERIRASTVEAKDRAKVGEKAAKKVEDDKVRVTSKEVWKARKGEEEALKSSSNPSSLKRPLDSDAISSKPKKRVASEATAVGSGQKGLAGKGRVPSFFENLKRPGLKSTITSRVANPPASTKKPEPKPEPTSTPQSSLAEILASIEKPREAPKAPEAPPRPPETSEEKARRERKESRRHLRVHWKDGNALTEIRLFKHELAEDEGRQDNMLRDAHDDRSEGMMLKQRVLENMADDEDDGAAEVDYRPYPELTSIDFTEIDRDTREKSYVTRGGHLSINTPQKEIQDRRESLELMVVYTDPKDIPPSPKEPPQVNSDKPPAERAFGQPAAEWLVKRLTDIYQYGQATAMSVSARRLEEQRVRTNYVNIGQGISGSPDITSILNAMKGLPQNASAPQKAAYHQPAAPTFTSPQDYSIRPFSPQPNTDTDEQVEQKLKMANNVFANLARIADELKGKPYPPNEPPAWMTERGKFEWWEGYHRDQSATRLKTESAELRARQAQLQGAQAHIPPVQAPAPQMQYPQLGTYPVPPPPSMATGIAPSYDAGQLQKVLAGLNNAPNNSVPAHLQSILSGLNNGQGNQSLLQQQQNWAGGWPSATSGATIGQSYNSQPQPSRWDSTMSNNSSTGNARPSHNENSRSTYDIPNQENTNQRARDGGYTGEDRHRGNNPPEYKRGKKPCKFWHEGKCAKGVNCTFLHE